MAQNYPHARLISRHLCSRQNCGLAIHDGSSVADPTFREGIVWACDIVIFVSHGRVSSAEYPKMGQWHSLVFVASSECLVVWIEATNTILDKPPKGVPPTSRFGSNVDEHTRLHSVCRFFASFVLRMIVLRPISVDVRVCRVSNSDRCSPVLTFGSNCRCR